MNTPLPFAQTPHGIGPNRAELDQVRISGQPVDFELNRIDSEGFVVGIPRIHIQRTEELIEVDFRAEVFTFGTVFSGRIFDSQRPHEVPQSITRATPTGWRTAIG